MRMRYHGEDYCQEEMWGLGYCQQERNDRGMDGEVSTIVSKRCRVGVTSAREEWERCEKRARGVGYCQKEMRG